MMSFCPFQVPKDYTSRSLLVRYSIASKPTRHRCVTSHTKAKMSDWKPPKAGCPVWLGISTKDLSRAEAFYATVFNWTFKDAPRREDHQPDHHAKTRLFDLTPGGVALSGGLQHRPEDEGTGTPAAGPGGVCLYWLVEDLGRVAEVIVKAGGKMVGSAEPLKEGESGLYRYFEDTEGNVGGVYQMV
ncbi:uncharacterized protein B0T15DRAFT_543513 [Chaetomium strumarium]|uniref:VOC domain-containing protein n=1 Tax=Chaetomium strumarium TaxID=1170767 RepID=A0AAJ0GMV2_9PEZI|nr:hypothetical protein B0T15DRAFT_543513 [Chaetomium strumarium]